MAMPSTPTVAVQQQFMHRRHQFGWLRSGPGAIEGNIYGTMDWPKPLSTMAQSFAAQLQFVQFEGKP
jgi:hypothetical protein